MRICHVTSVHPAKDARIFYKECASLAKEYEVFLIAPNVNDEFTNGIHIVGVALPQSRFRRMLSLNLVFRKAMDVNAVVYHLHDPELMPLGNRLLRRGKKVIFDSHEDVPAQILVKEYLPRWIRNPLSGLYAGIERLLLRKYTALVSVTPSIVERLESINPRTTLITNFPIINEWRENQIIDFDKREYVCFAGSINKRYLHDVIISSIEKTKARYLLAGPAYPSYLEFLKGLKGWSRVDYLGMIDYCKVPDLYTKSFAGIVLLDYCPNVGYRRGTLGVLKMFEYMFAGIPVIATDFDIWKEIIEGNNCGTCINPHDSGAIAEAIDFYYNHPEIAKSQGENGRRAVLTKYNWATQEKELLALYKRILSSDCIPGRE